MAAAEPLTLPDANSARPCVEGQWLVRHVSGDGTAFAELMQAYSNPIYGYLTRCGVHGPERDDLFQEIFSRVHRAAPSYDPDRALRPWLFTIAVNTVRNHFRSKQSRPKLELAAVEPTAEPASPAPGPQEVMDAQQTAAWLEEELEKLPLQQREVVVLCCIEQVDQKSAAESLGIPVNTVKTLLRRARLAMAKALVRRQQEGRR